MNGRRVTALLFGLAILVGAGVVPAFEPLSPSLPAHYTPAANALEAGLWMQTVEAEEAIATSPRRIQDAALEAYLHDILCRLVPDYCADIRVYVMRVPAFNASMMPNGAMQVWTGLLLRVQNEAQLATVLAHELGHYLRRHSLQRFEDLRSKSNWLTLFTIGLGAAVGAGGVSPTAAQGASLSVQLATLGSAFAFSRANESEADKYGIQLLAGAGYAPAQAAQVWRDLIDEQRAEDPERDGGGVFFATHPSEENRLATLGGYARELDGQQRVSDDEARARYYAAVGARLPEFFADELRQNHMGRSEHLFQRLASANFAPGLVNFYLGEIARMRDTGKLSDEARQRYEAALAYPDAPPETHRALGLWYLKARQREAARAELERYLERAPAASDREMIQFYLSQIGSAS